MQDHAVMHARDHIFSDAHAYQNRSALFDAAADRGVGSLDVQSAFGESQVGHTLRRGPPVHVNDRDPLRLHRLRHALQTDIDNL